MTDKERIEMIKHDLEERGQYGGFLDDCDTEWLIKQVEKLEELKATADLLLFQRDIKIDQQRKEIEKLKKEVYDFDWAKEI